MVDLKGLCVNGSLAGLGIGGFGGGMGMLAMHSSSSSRGAVNFVSNAMGQCFRGRGPAEAPVNEG